MSRKRFKVGDRVRVTVKGEAAHGIVSSVRVSPRVYWYGITLDDNRYVSRHEDDVEKENDIKKDK